MMTDATKRWTRNIQDEAAVRDGCWFDEPAAENIAAFFPKFLRHHQGEFAGKPFELLPWEHDIVMQVFGWKRADGTRRFRQVTIWIPKKNGKSQFGGGLGIVGLVGDREPGAEVYSAACTREQAGIIYERAEAMIQASPELSSRLGMIPSKKRITHAGSKSYYQALSADAGANEGRHASMVIQDELHAWSTGPGRKLYASLKYAGTARRQPLKIDISTAGDNTESIGYDRYLFAKQIASGAIENWEILPVIYGADPEDNPDDEATWRKANPSLGVTMSLQSFRSDWQEAKQNPAEWNNFLRYRLNLWVTAHTQWIKPDEWALCVGDVRDKDLIGKPCCGGLDLAHSRDSTAWVLCWPLDDEVYAVRAHFFLPDGSVDRLESTDGVPYRRWADAGYYTLTSGAVTDYAFVKDRIRSDCARYDVREIAYDPHMAAQLATEMTDEGYPMVEFRQGWVSMSEPCKQFQRMTISRKLAHGGNPVLAWMIANTVDKVDPAGNTKLDKAASKKRIDGSVASVMAFGRARVMPKLMTSVYEDRGLLSV